MSRSTDMTLSEIIKQVCGGGSVRLLTEDGQPTYIARELCRSLIGAGLVASEHEPAGWFESPHGAFRANPLYRFDWPAHSVAWRVPLYAATQDPAPPLAVPEVQG